MEFLLSYSPLWLAGLSLLFLIAGVLAGQQGVGEGQPRLHQLRWLSAHFSAPLMTPPWGVQLASKMDTRRFAAGLCGVSRTDLAAHVLRRTALKPSHNQSET